MHLHKHDSLYIAGDWPWPSHCSSPSGRSAISAPLMALVGMVLGMVPPEAETWMRSFSCICINMTPFTLLETWPWPGPCSSLPGRSAISAPLMALVGMVLRTVPPEAETWMRSFSHIYINMTPFTLLETWPWPSPCSSPSGRSAVSTPLMALVGMVLGMVPPEAETATQGWLSHLLRCALRYGLSEQEGRFWKSCRSRGSSGQLEIVLSGEAHARSRGWQCCVHRMGHPPPHTHTQLSLPGAVVSVPSCTNDSFNVLGQNDLTFTRTKI